MKWSVKKPLLYSRRSINVKNRQISSPPPLALIFCAVSLSRSSLAFSPRLPSPGLCTPLPELVESSLVWSPCPGSLLPRPPPALGTRHSEPHAHMSPQGQTHCAVFSLLRVESSSLVGQPWLSWLIIPKQLQACPSDSPVQPSCSHQLVCLFKAGHMGSHLHPWSDPSFPSCLLSFPLLQSHISINLSQLPHPGHLSPLISIL